MNGISTITQKGQVVIPQLIRNSLGLTPATRVYMEVQDDTVVIKPIPTIENVYGMIPAAKQTFSKEKNKSAIRRAVGNKFHQK
jgi:AbrB family looped-hinge helix DNA binding protein